MNLKHQIKTYESNEAQNEEISAIHEIYEEIGSNFKLKSSLFKLNFQTITL
jgi:ribosomal protein L20A (L18A)